MRLITSEIAVFSARSLFINLSRAGVAKNRSRTSMTVPGFVARGRTSDTVPPVTEISKPFSEPGTRLRMLSLETDPIEGNASPRNPSELMSSNRSSIFEVQCRSIARRNSSLVIPQPLSMTRINALPPDAVAISIRVAPASIAFSTSSLITLEGRSTTSPAAI